MATNRTLRIGAVALAALGLGAAATGASLGAMLRRSLPETAGTLRVRGLEGPVEILRDRRGRPHIYAGSRYDLFFGQGFATAQDRLWQMDLQRRVANGTLAEAIGPAGLDADRLFRRLGLRRSAERDLAATGEARLVAEAYAAGVNAWLERSADRPPIEFVLLRLEPERWSAVDCLAWARLMSFSLCMNWESEVLRSRFVARLGVAGASRLEPDVWQPGTGAVPEDVDFGSPAAPRPVPTADLFTVVPTGAGASNAWAVAGHRSTVGRPLLASDPHLGPRLPSIWHEAHLVGDGFDVIGAALPGAPGILIGHNQRIAWGVTAALADVEDLYVERFDPANPRRYRFGDRWLEAEVVQETIRVRGRSRPIVEEVRITRHGPVVTPTPAIAGEDRTLALRSTVLEHAGQAEAALRLARASGWDEFRAALADWTAPPLNFIYADVDGNVGYQFAGLVPVRARGAGLVPAPGDTGEYEWTGWVPFDELPSAFNPPEGYCANANHRIVPDQYPHLISREWIDDYRIRRIRELLDARERHSLDDLAAIQTDLCSLPARDLAPYFAELSAEGTIEAQALAHLRTWDLRLEADSVGAAVFQALLRRLQANVFGPTVGDLLPYLLGLGLHPQLIPTTAIGYRAASRLLAALRDVEREERAALLRRSFSEAVSALRSELGDDVARWTWGRLHQLTIRHPLGIWPPLDRLFNLGPFPIGGDMNTVCQVAVDPVQPFQAGAWVPSYRLLVDLADFDRSRSVLPGGISGHRASRHYADQIGDWLAGRYAPLPFSRAAVEAEAEAGLLLEPEPQSDRVARVDGSGGAKQGL